MAARIAPIAAALNLVIEQGATFSVAMTWRDENSQPIDLTGYTARMQIRSEIASTTPLHELTTENGGIVLGGVAGTIALTIPATTTAGFTWLQGVYDLELISGTGVVTRLLRGAVSVMQEVTRD